MKKSLLALSLSICVSFTATRVFAQTPAQDSTQTTAAAGAGDVVGALNSNTDYTTAAQAVKAANLETDLKAGGPYTIFAPNNAAFSKLPQAQLDSLMKDPVKLATVLKGHVVTGKYAKADIIKALNTGKGKATMTTIDGQTLTLGITANKTLQLTKPDGTSAEVILYDLIGQNGIVNGINTVLAPAK